MNKMGLLHLQSRDDEAWRTGTRWRGWIAPFGLPCLPLLLIPLRPKPNLPPLFSSLHVARDGFPLVPCHRALATLLSDNSMDYQIWSSPLNLVMPMKFSTRSPRIWFDFPVLGFHVAYLCWVSAAGGLALIAIQEAGWQVRREKFLRVWTGAGNFLFDAALRFLEVFSSSV